MFKNRIRIEWLLAALFTLDVYIFYFLCLIGVQNHTWIFPALIGLIFTIIIVVYCLGKIFKSKDVIRDAKTMRRVMLFIKLILIPIFVANFLLTLMAAGLFTILPTGIIFTPIVIVIGSTISIVIILTTSAFSISAIILSYNPKYNN